MKKKRFTIEQIVAVLKQAELGCRRWKKQYAGMQSDQVRELKQLQEENGRSPPASGY